MKIKFLMAIAGPAIFLSLAGQSWAESQPAPGTFAIEQYIVKQSPNCSPNEEKQTFHGVFYYPGPDSLGATLRIAHNDGAQFHWTIVNNLPRTPSANVAVWSGGFSGFISPPNAPPTPFSGTLVIPPSSNTTMTWVDGSTFTGVLNTTTILGCQTTSHITGWRTNLNQAPLY